MSDAKWGDEGEAAPKKRVPTWLWFCGGGCLLASILAVVALGFVFSEVKTWKDGDQQLPALAKALPFDELPPELEFQFAIRFPFDWFIFSDSRGFVLWFFVAPPGQAAELRRTILNPESDGGFMGMGGRQDTQAATVAVQGRELRGVRFYQGAGSGGESGAGANQEGNSILLEVGPEDGDGVVVMQILRPSSREAITDEDVRMILKPFHVGPDR